MHLPEEEATFIRNLHAATPELAQLHAEIEAKRLEGYYRFYHHSWKVYHLQHYTEQIVKALQSLLPERALNEWFAQIIAEGTGRKWEQEHNEDWLHYTLPIMVAFDHARYFLEVAVSVGKRYDKPCEGTLPYDYAGLLYLFDLR